MPGNSIGQAFRLTSWGESHGVAIGGVIDGIPPGISLNLAKVQQALDRRRPGKTLTSQRQETDQLHILSGFFDEKTTGTPLSFQLINQDSRSQDYHSTKHVFRPGHADYTYQKKYGHVDYRGGGRASARETAIRVAAGAIAAQVINHVLGQPISIQAALVQMGEKKADLTQWDWEFALTNDFFCPDKIALPDWRVYLEGVQEKGLSVGALIEVRALGVPAGLGEPVYDKLDADLAKALMSINAVKGVEIGDGFSCLTSPVGYDEMSAASENDVSFLSNRAGGILGGISTGQPIICRVAFKPTSSTKQSRQTITHNNQNTTISISGRHDPCVGIRAVPIVEAMVGLVLADHLLRWRGQCGR